MSDDALEAQKFSRRHLVLELDFSAASVGEIEASIESLDYALAGGRSPKNVQQLKRLWGSYLGEAIRRQTQAEWFCDEHETPRLVANGKTIFPHQQVELRLTEGSEHDLAAFFEHALEEL